MSNAQPQPEMPWYHGITRYQWIVLIIASAGWIFDVYEGQIFNITRNDMLKEILGQDAAGVAKYGDFFLAIFLLGGTLGGLLFGSLADRYGRRPIMMVTILMYSLFSGLTFFAETLWHVGVLRFLVAMGVGGEWAVAAALVAEVFPTRARAHASGIFHASSVLGTWLAAIAGLLVATQWRYAYLIGILPALLILWVRISVKEPETWKKKRAAGEKGMGSFVDLLGDRQWRGRALLAMLLAAIGLGTFWAVTVAGQDLAREAKLAAGATEEEAGQAAKFAYGILQTIGSGLGLLAFGPISARIGRKKTFIFFHAAALVIVPVTCFGPQSYTQLLIILPVFGFFTLGMHAGYAIYFPELFPTNLRATGTSFCFNGGRLLAAPILYYSGTIKAATSLPWAITGMASLYLVGIVLVLFLPETRGKDLIE